MFRIIRLTLLFTTCLLWTSILAQDTTVVETFVFSSQSRDSVFTFPDDGPYRQIIMEYGMRCHDLAVGNNDVGCREWDYSCNTIIYDSTRVDSLLVDDGNGNLVYEERTPSRYEIMSFVTPYGNGLDLGPDGVMWQFDVTDFAPILKGKKRMGLIAGGEYQEEMNITFKFIKGTPPRNVIDIRPIWPLSLGTNVNHIADNRVFEPREINVPAGVDAIKLRSIVTGHGQNGEFTPYVHKMKVDDQEFDYTVWLDCSNIPVYPQGGTWIFDRAGWCPGDPSQVNEFWVPGDALGAGQFTVDYDIPNIRGLSEARYIVNNQMVMYGPINHDNDLAIHSVLRPSDRTEFSRVNPSCYEPSFVIQNRGRETLTTAEIEFGIRGLEKGTVQWNGSLDYLEMDTIVVDYANFGELNQGEEYIFEVQILTTDDQPDNNTYVEHFEGAPVFMTDYFQVLLTTNKRAVENELRIWNENNVVVYEGIDLLASRSYFHELFLSPGCYKLLLTDSNGDGLYYWFYERDGNGPGRGGLELFADEEEVAEFDPEFGGFLQYEFTVSNPSSTSDEAGLGEINIFPNPASDAVLIEAKNNPFESDIRIFNTQGQLVVHQPIKKGSFSQKIDLSFLKGGIYMMQWDRNGQIHQAIVVVQR